MRGGCACITVGAKGEGLRLTAMRAEGFSRALDIACEGRHIQRETAARRRLPGRQRARRGGSGARRPARRRRKSSRRSKTRAARRAGWSWPAQQAGAPIFVDYAHKPDALEKVLQALRPLATGRLIVVFGCGGDRDPGKRPMMGEIAAELADVRIVTDDNPRSEEPAAHPRRDSGRRARRQRNRRPRARPSAPASTCCGEGDVLVIAGKGHETGQIIGGTCCRFPIDDAEARAALAEVADERAVLDGSASSPRSERPRAGAPPAARPAFRSTAARCSRRPVLRHQGRQQRRPRLCRRRPSRRRGGGRGGRSATPMRCAGAGRSMSCATS